MQRAGSGATQPGSPPVTLAVLVTVVVLVLVAFNVTTVWLTAPAATAAVAVQVIVAGPTALVGVHVQLAPLVRLVIVKPAGTVSVITVGRVEATGPELLTTIE